METFGSILDKITILERRIKELRKRDEGYYHLYNQYGWLFKSLGDHLTECFSGRKPFTFDKHKIYDKEISVENELNFLSVINLLNECNNKLWDLEDIRRDKSLTDNERLEAADKVSEYNKLRNDCIDRIDQYIEKAARSSHESIFK